VDWLWLIPIAGAMVILMVWSIARQRKEKRERKKLIEGARRLLMNDILDYEIKNPSGRQPAAAPRFRRLVLCLYVETDPPKRYVMDPAVGIVIGSSPECQVWLSDVAVAPKHCYISSDGKTATIQDLGSPKGTEVHRGVFRARALRSSAVVLRDKDRFLVGAISFRVRLFVFDGRTA